VGLKFIFKFIKTILSLKFNNLKTKFDFMMDFVAIPEERMKLLRSDKRLVEKLENLVDVKINLGESVEIDGDDPLLVMRVKSVIKAFGRGFDFEDALNLLDEEFKLCIIDIKDFSGKSSSRLNELRGRIIGTKGKSKAIIEKLGNVKLSIYGKTISIIGKWDGVECTREAVCMLLEGRKHGSIYKFLEENIKKTKY